MDTPSDMKAVIEEMRQLRVSVLAVPISSESGSAPFVVTPPNFGVRSLQDVIEASRESPKRSKATTVHGTLDSWIEHVLSFGDSGKTAIYCNMADEKISLVAIYDHDEISHDGTPGWAENRATYNARFSTEWQGWAQHDKTAMGQGEFAEFLEEKSMHIIPPEMVGKSGIVEKALAAVGGPLGGPTDLMQLARSIQVHESHSAAASVDLATGEQSISWTVENKGTDKAKVPRLFVIGIPVLHGGVRYQVPVRLRYASRGGIVWTYVMFGREAVFLDVAADVLKEVKERLDGYAIFEGVYGR